VDFCQGYLLGRPGKVAKGETWVPTGWAVSSET